MQALWGKAGGDELVSPHGFFVRSEDGTFEAPERVVELLISSGHARRVGLAAVTFFDGEQVDAAQVSASNEAAPAMTGPRSRRGSR